jgi:hypothetical protein
MAAYNPHGNSDDLVSDHLNKEEAFMRMLFKLFFFLFVLAFARISLATEPPVRSILGKSDIQNIKILGQNSERISFYLTDTKNTKYRIADLSQHDANTILAHIKNQKNLVLETQPNKRGYLDVLKWRQEP